MNPNESGKGGLPFPSNVVDMMFRREGNNNASARRAYRPHVLIVEDSAVAADATGLLLRAGGARVRWADSVAMAERHLNSYQPDYIIVDPGLPDGCGLQLVQRLHNVPGEGPRLIVVSGDDTREGAALAAGAHCFFRKPVPVAALLREIMDRDADTPLRGPAPSAPVALLIADLHQARLQILRATLCGDDEAIKHPIQFLTSLAQSCDLPELSRLLSRMQSGRDTPRDLAAGLARMINIRGVREQPARA